MSSKSKIILATLASCVVLTVLPYGWKWDALITNLKSNPIAAIIIIIAIIACAFIVAGRPKEKAYTQHMPKKQHKAASIHLAVTLVSPWEDYVSSLQPKFEIDAGGALERVIPTTMLLEERVMDSLGLTGKVGLPQTFKTDKNIISVKNGVETSEREKTQERKPGQRPETSGAGATPSIKDSDLRGLPEGSEKSLSEEPMLEYTAAAALFQEVQMLNRYVKDAALRYEFMPYIVRMQVGVMPYARNQPLDVYTTFGFIPFSGNKGSNNYEAIVLPLLVTDNLEGALKSKTIDNIRQIALALSFSTGGVYGEAGFDRMREDMDSVLGTDINSLLTVGRVTDGAIQVRLGAARQASSEYAMIPRTHNITLLVMVPKGFIEDSDITPKVRVVAKNVLRRTDNGKKICDRTNVEETKEYIAVLKEYYGGDDEAWEPDDGVVKNLRIAMFENNYQRFSEILKGMQTESTSGPRSVWMEFIEIAGKNDLTSTVFDLPRPEGMEWPVVDQAVLLMDDTKSTLSGKLCGGKGINPDYLSALLNLRLKNDETLPIMATSVSVDSEGGNPVLTFPSLRAWKISGIDMKGSLLNKSYIELKYTPKNLWNTQAVKGPVNYSNIYYIAKEKTILPPAFSVRPALDTITVNNDSTGALQLFIESEKKNNRPLTETVEIVIANAQIEKVEPRDIVNIDLGKITSPTDATLNFSLMNLVVGETVIVKAKGIYDGDPPGGPHPPIEIRVRKNK
jgi:hypothetical protein